MPKNSEILKQIISGFLDQPFFLLPQTAQDKNLGSLKKYFVSLRGRLLKQQAQQTSSGRMVENLIQILETEPLNEYKLARAMSALLEKAGQAGKKLESQELQDALKQLVKRAKPLWVSEVMAVKMRGQLNAKQIQNHDREILEKQGQLWMFDFFFFYDKVLREAEGAEKNRLIFRGQEGMPSLIEDALSESPLANCVYSLYGKELRKEMIGDYYEYKQLFLDIEKDEAISETQIQKIQTGLRRYCLKLIEISLRHGIATVANVLHFPYGKGKSMMELKMELSE